MAHFKVSKCIGMCIIWQTNIHLCTYLKFHYKFIHVILLYLCFSSWSLAKKRLLVVYKQLKNILCVECPVVSQIRMNKWGEAAPEIRINVINVLSKMEGLWLIWIINKINIWIFSNNIFLYNTGNYKCIGQQKSADQGWGCGPNWAVPDGGEVSKLEWLKLYSIFTIHYI